MLFAPGKEGSKRSQDDEVNPGSTMSPAVSWRPMRCRGGALEVALDLAALACADAVMTTSSLLRHGINHLRVLLDDLRGWCVAREYDALGRFRGIMSRRRLEAPEGFERANYIRILQGYSGSGGRARL